MSKPAREIANQTSDPLYPWQTTTLSYMPGGQKQTETGPKGNVTAYQYDSADRMSSVTDAENHARNINITRRPALPVIDALGISAKNISTRPMGTSERQRCQGNLTTYQYDDFDRLARTTYPTTVTSSLRMMRPITSRRSERGRATHHFRLR